MCLYDLQKAFDSVEFPVLLRNLFDIGLKPGASCTVGILTVRVLYVWDNMYLNGTGR